MPLHFHLVLQKTVARISRDLCRVQFPLGLDIPFSLIFICILFKFTLSLLAAIMNFAHHQTTTLRRIRPILQQLRGPKSMECAPSHEGGTPAQGCQSWFTARYTRDVFTPREIQRSVFSKHVDFSELTTRNRKNICESEYALCSQVYPEISPLWINQVEMIQWEAACTRDWLVRWIHGESLQIKRNAPKPNSNRIDAPFNASFLQQT